jgi:CubicO group peptidase (beta-lactamase class C family)
MRRLLAVLTAAALLAACGTSGDEPGSEPAAGEGGQDCDPEMDEAFGAWAEAGFSGSVAVSAGGEFECVAGYGLADEATGTANAVDTVFSIGSVSKAFAAAAVLDLVDAGRLALSDRAGDLVPGLGGPAAGATVEQLLLHTSGLTGAHGEDHEPLGHDEAVAAISGLELAIEPGSDYLYSNAGYTLLALIVEEASGQDYREYLASEILPLPGGEVAGGFWDGEPAVPGPRAVGHLDEESTGEMGDFEGPHWALAGNGDLAMTMRDLASWTHALFTGRVVAPAAAEAIGRPGFDHGEGASETPGWVALDASAFGEPLLAASGGGGDIGHDAVVVWLPDSERVMTIASNTPDVRAEELLQAVGPALVAGDPLPTPEVVGDVDPDDAAAVAGTYELESGGSLEVAGRDDRLAISATGADAVAALFPLPDDVTAEDVAAHERNVTALLAGETSEGREERAALESDLGPIERVELAGSAVEDGELGTYAIVSSAAESLLVWYALDDEGGAGAADAGVEPPSLVLGAADGGGYRPDDPAGNGPDVTVTFDEGRMTVSGPAGEVTARLAA